jgi:hypothetical protein
VRPGPDSRSFIAKLPTHLTIGGLAFTGNRPDWSDQLPG